MSVRGRKPKPVELRVIEGNREHRKIPKAPKPRKNKNIPDPPGWLVKYAKTEWKRIVPELYNLGLLTKIDTTALEAYCQCYARWREAEEKLKVEVSITDNGYESPSAYINISNKYSKEMRSYLVEFGMTPSSRTRIGTDIKDSDKEGWEKLLA